MKRLICIIFYFFLFIGTKAENGLGQIIVEKYYISDSNDEIRSDGKLPKNSVTYRIFVDMRPGYRFQAAYGIPGHVLHFTTSTHFFNSENGGASIANDIHGSKLTEGTVMLDSWLSVGAAGEKYQAVLKENDTSGAIANTSGFFLSTNPVLDIPLSRRDGMYPASPLPAVNFYGIDSTQLSVFNDENSRISKQVFSTENGSWACIGGSMGADSTNAVLIAQLTTDGEFSFELNVQIGTPGGGVENYVAKDPQGEEMQLKSLSFSTKEMLPDQSKLPK